jgi:hypothetical protein
VDGWCGIGDDFVIPAFPRWSWRSNADPATVRPSLAVAAAENVEQLTASLLEAAGSAVKPVWLTVECTACGERSRVEAPVPDSIGTPPRP